MIFVVGSHSGDNEGAPEEIEKQKLSGVYDIPNFPELTLCIHIFPNSTSGDYTIEYFVRRHDGHEVTGVDMLVGRRGAEILAVSWCENGIIPRGNIHFVVADFTKIAHHHAGLTF